MPIPRIAPKRKAVQWLTSLLILIIPFVSLDGESLLRLDATSRTLLFFGSRIRVEEFYLLLLVALLLVFSFLFITVVFGRVWCGWLCPQSTFSDLAEYLARKLQLLLPRALSRTLRYLLMLLFSFLVAANLIWYFIPPREFMQRLMSGTLGVIAGTTLATVLLLIFLDLVFVRRKFCKTICPYGRIQLMAMDNSTLTLEMNPESAGSCIRCGACVRACPMQIDIREGLQVECINCGRCLDACRGVMEKLNKDQGLIHYSFGSRSKGRGRPLNTGSLLLAGMIIALSALLCYGITTRSAATLKVQQSGNGETRSLPDGSLVNFYRAYVGNRSAKAAFFDLTVTPLPGYETTLLGPANHISIGENTSRRIDFTIRIKPAPTAPQQVELRLIREGKTEAAAFVTILTQ